MNRQFRSSSCSRPELVAKQATTSETKQPNLGESRVKRAPRTCSHQQNRFILEYTMFIKHSAHVNDHEQFYKQWIVNGCVCVDSNIHTHTITHTLVIHHRNRSCIYLVGFFRFIVHWLLTCGRGQGDDANIRSTHSIASANEHFEQLSK